MKKWIAWLLALTMLLSLSVSAFAAEDGEEEEELILDPQIVADMGVSVATAIAMGANLDEIVFYDHITVGNTTPMRGDFFTDLWGNATSDADVRNLLNGYNLVIWDGNGGAFRANSAVVTGVVVTENPEGDHNYTFALANDLRYSDGTRITAWDYAFSILLQISPELAELGAVPAQKNYLFGIDEYLSGRAQALAGVRVTADDVLSVTIRNEYLPFFFEMGLLSCDPYPIHVIAPGVQVKDDGNGVYLANADARIQQPIFTVDLLRQTIADPATGYRSHPSVVSGAYTLESWDGTTAEFAVNPYFKGNHNGEHGLIQNITFTLSKNENMIGALTKGEFDLLNKVVNADAVTAGMAEIAEGGIRMSNYPRSGLSYVIYACEKPALASKNVRQAIALCMDRDAIVADYTGNFGQRVDGYFGVGQWMYGLVNGTTAPPVDPPENENDPIAVAAYEAELAAWEALTLDNLKPYALNVEEAVRLLEADGWKLNNSGVREKKINGETVVLDFTLVYPEGNTIGESLREHFIPHLKEAGIRLRVKELPMAEISELAYAKERDVDMIYLATNFDIIYDPSVTFALNGELAPSQQTDNELYRLAAAMNETEPGNVLEYVQKWIAFEERFNEVLPMIPIYSNVYFDFYTELLHDYNITENTTWAESILGAVKAEIPEMEVEEPAEEEDLEFEG